MKTFANVTKRWRSFANCNVNVHTVNVKFQKENKKDRNYFE